MMQKALTAIIKVDPAKAADLEKVLNIIGQDIRGIRDNHYIDFTKFQTIHFMRWVLIPNDVTGQREYLLFTTNYDGKLADHLLEFVDHAGGALDAIFGCCVGYPTNRTTDENRFRRDFARFINRHSIDYEAFYVGYRGESFHSVRNFIDVANTLQGFLDLGDVQRFVTSKLNDLLAKLPLNPERATIFNKLADLIRGLQKVALFVLDFLWHLVIVFIFRPLRRFILRREPALNLTLKGDSIRPGVESIEDVVTQNQMSVISKIKPGLWQLIRLKIVLLLIWMVHKHFMNQGALGGIITIHFARWAILDKGRYLFFESNYDGSWESYIGEFVDKAASGMDLIWTCTPDYPAGGARNIEGFKAIIRNNQLKTQTFYSAYPNSTVRNILNDRVISQALEQSAVRAWLKRF